MSSSPFHGVGTALVTPFKADGSIDYACLADFVEFQISNGVDFLVPLGTTGETVTMTEEEKIEVFKTVTRAAKGRVPVLAGCGGNDTAHIVEKALVLKEAGATHILSVSPYYNKPTQEGIYQHYRAIKQETGLGIVLYSVQGRTGSNVQPETVARLVDDGIVFGIKEASGSIQQIQKICALCGDALDVFAGDDAITLPLMACGGKGVVSVASNVIPGPMRDWMDALETGDYRRAMELLRPILPVFEALFVESNPIPVKGAASLLGLMEAHYRLPLVAPSEGTMVLLQKVLQPYRKAA